MARPLASIAARADEEHEHDPDEREYAARSSMRLQRVGSARRVRPQHAHGLTSLRSPSRRWPLLGVRRWAAEPIAKAGRSIIAPNGTPRLPAGRLFAAAAPATAARHASHTCCSAVHARAASRQSRLHQPPTRRSAKPTVVHQKASEHICLPRNSNFIRVFVFPPKGDF